MTFEHKPGDRYFIIGKDVHGKRFRIASDNPWYILAINAYQGRIYQVRNGRRKKIGEIFN